MRLRSQTLLAVVPLFIVLGLAGMAVAWRLETGALRNGLEREGRSMAVALAEYLSGDASQLEDHVAMARMDTRFEPLLQRNVVSQISLWDGTGRLVSRWPKQMLGAEAADLATPWISARDTAGSSDQASSWLDIPVNRVPVVYGGAVVLSQAGEVAGWVECQLDADEWEAEVRAIKERLIRNLVVTVLSGLVLSVLISQIMIIDVRRLLGVAGKVGEGNYLAPAGLRLREIDDLGETFGVLDGLTHEYRQKFRRSMTENEIFRTSADLARVYAEQVMPRFTRELAGRRVVSGFIGRTEPGHWHGGAEHEGRAWLWQGAIEQGQGLRAAQVALVVDSELRSLLVEHGLDVQEALLELVTMYPVSVVRLVTWTVNREALDTYGWNSTSRTATHLMLRSDRHTILHDLEGDLASTIEVFRAEKPTERIESLFGHLERVLGDRPAVLTLVEAVKTLEAPRNGDDPLLT